MEQWRKVRPDKNKSCRVLHRSFIDLQGVALYATRIFLLPQTLCLKGLKQIINSECLHILSPPPFSVKVLAKKSTTNERGFWPTIIYRGPRTGKSITFLKVRAKSWKVREKVIDAKSLKILNFASLASWNSKQVS